jgi:O-antigen/teichoic acid export membrane protein
MASRRGANLAKLLGACLQNDGHGTDGESPPSGARGVGRMERAPRIVREGFWVGSSQVAAVTAGLVGVRLLTTILPPGVYGQVVLLMGLGTLGTGLFCSPFLQAALRYYPDARRTGGIGALRGLTAHWLRLGLVATFLCLAFASSWRSVVGAGAVPAVAFAAVAAFVASDAWRSYESGFLNGDRRQADFALRTTLDAWARPLAAVGLAWSLGASALHVVTGFAVGSALVGLALFRRVVPGEKGSGSWEDHPWTAAHRRGFVRYALPLVPLAALNWLMSVGDRYVLAGTWGTLATGLYAAAYGLGSQPFIATTALIHTTLRPVLYDAVARGDASKERRTLRTWLAIVAVTSLGGWAAMTVLARPICALLLGPAYGGAATILPWIAGAYALQSVQQTFEVILYAHRGTRRLVALQGIAAATAIVFYLILVPPYGAFGAALGTLLAFLVTTATAFFLSNALRHLGFVGGSDARDP